MTSRSSLHRLVDDLPETEIPRAERLLEVLKESAVPVRLAMDDAPEDDEPESPEEAQAVAQAWREHGAGKGFTTDEVKRKLGLA